MKSLFLLTTSLVSRINALIMQSERAHPGMQEVAAHAFRIQHPSFASRSSTGVSARSAGSVEFLPVRSAQTVEP